MEKKKKLLLNTVIIGIGKFSSQIIVFLMLPLYTSHLSTGEYGTYDSLIAIATFLTPFITMLFEESMFRYLIEYRNSEKKSKVISNTLIFCILSLICFSILYFIFCLFVDFEYKEYFIVYIIFNVLYSISNAVARGLGKIKEYSISNFIANALMVVFNLISILILKLGVPGLFISYSMGIFFAILFVAMKLNIKEYFSIKNFDKKLFVDMFKYSLPLVPNSISWSIINVSDRVMLTYMCSSSINGIYSVSNKFPQAMGSLYNFFSIAWKESASVELGDNKYYTEIFEKIIKLLLIVATLILLFLPWVYGIFVSESFIDSFYYVPILLIAMMFSNISEFYSGILIAYKNTKLIGLTTISSAVINILINLILMKKFGILAASISTLVSTSFICILRKNIIKKYVEIKIEYSKTWIYIILLLVAIGTYYLNNNLIRAIINIVYCCLLIVLNKSVINMMFAFMKKERKKIGHK